jgi:hypothetical protein
MMIIDILMHTPIWVWAIFGLLGALGFAQTRDRDVSRLRVTSLPLVFVALSFVGVLRPGAGGGAALAAWGSGFAAILVFARRALAVRGARWSNDAGALHVPGSWVPMGLILGLFSLKYGMGVLAAIRPDIARNLAISLSAQSVYGLFAGCFWVRSASLRSVAAPREVRDARAGAAV